MVEIPQANSTPKSVIIFDCDGVLFESNRLKTKAFGMVLQGAGFTDDVVHEFVTYHQMNGGISRYVKFRRLYTDIIHQPLPVNGIDDLLSKFSAACIELYSSADFTPGCVEVLKALSSDYVLYVASGGDQNELRSVFRQRKIDGFFESILGSPMTKSDCVKTIMDNVDAGAKCIMVGDSASDWRAANEHGIDFVFMKTFSEDITTMSCLASENGFPVIEDLQQLGGLL